MLAGCADSKVGSGVESSEETALETAGETSQKTDTEVVSQDSAATISSEIESTTINEFICVCGMCGDVEGYRDVEKHIFGHDINFSFKYGECEKNNERMMLTERAVKLIIDLDKDFEEAIEQIRFKDNIKNYNDLFERLYKGEFGKLSSIFSARIFFRDDNQARADVFVGFSDEHRGFWTSVIFEEDDGEWIILTYTIRHREVKRLRKIKI